MGRATARTAIGAATAAVLAVTTPTAAAQRPRPLTRTGATAPGAVVTLVTGGRVLVTKDGATALPGEDGTNPFTLTRQSGKDLYVCAEGAVAAIAAGRVDEGLFVEARPVRLSYWYDGGETWTSAETILRTASGPPRCITAEPQGSRSHSGPN
ncbi:hypothetical protein [Streptomyces sp. R41]|uniref:Secreted protein n=1 Tax=Streptomyces sp. R41 TaxID=3238632 RepID=A0AB39RR41_9ACTN